MAHNKRFQGGLNGNMNKHIRAATRAGIVIAAVSRSIGVQRDRVASSPTPTKYGFTNGQVIASAGAIPANTAFPFTIARDQQRRARSGWLRLAELHNQCAR